tara:strand:- start:14783 stop:15175 length:393 start_codon:yes stop_codon:yes gene_type:complete
MTLIKNVNHIKQAIDFTGLQNDKIHPSDIDAVLEFNNEALILMELKNYNSKGIPMGQRLLLERIVDSWPTRKAIVLEIRHDQLGTDAIQLHLCTVCNIYISGKWHRTNINVKECLNYLGLRWNIDKLFFE